MFTATPSGGWLQSSPVIPELGWPLGSRAQMFWLDERHPGALMPGKRPRSTLSVGMALRDGKPYMIWGTPGGDQQDQWNAQFFLRHVHFGMNLQEAIDAPAWHIEHFPASFWPRAARPGVVVVESRLPAATIAELKRRGHKVEVGPGLVGGPPDRRLAGRRAPPRRRQSARHAGLRGGAVRLADQQPWHVTGEAGGLGNEELLQARQAIDHAKGRRCVLPWRAASRSRTAC